MQFVGADADFRAQTVFKAVGKAGGGIDHDRAGIDFTQEAPGRGVVIGDGGLDGAIENVKRQ